MSGILDTNFFQRKTIYYFLILPRAMHMQKPRIQKRKKKRKKKPSKYES